MTINYTDNFLKALFRWNGSVWKSIWKETLVWLLAYYTIRLIFTFAIPESKQDFVKNLVKEFDEYTKRMPMDFLLGFYVTQVVTRWWNQAMLISSPHDIMGIIAAYINGSNEEDRRLRETAARYLVLYNALAYRNFSSKLKRLFPTNNSFLRVGLLTKEEKEILDKAPAGIAHELPYQWIIEIFREKAGNHNVLLNALTKHRTHVKKLAKHNDIAVPLVYTQTVTIAVYGYFLFALIGHQLNYNNYSVVDIFFPCFTLLRLICSVGWLKVAEYLSKPFGEDDDDVDLCKYLSSFCTNVFTIANYCSMYKPVKSWSYEESRAEEVKSIFDNGVTKYQRMGASISKRFGDVITCRQNVCRF